MQDEYFTALAAVISRLMMIPPPPAIHSDFESYCLAFRKANILIYSSDPPPIGQETEEAVEAADIPNTRVDAGAKAECGTVVAGWGGK